MNNVKNKRSLGWWITSVSLLTLVFVLAACGAGSGSGGATTLNPGVTATSTTTGNATSATTTTSSSGSAQKPTVPLTWIRMLDRMNGWALIKTQILKTADGGVHWKDVTPSSSPLTSTSQAAGTFMNTQYAWVASSQEDRNTVTIQRTTDGGQNWQATTISVPSPSVFDPPHFINTHEGWLEIITNGGPGAGQESADIWHSTDGGLHWSRIASTDQPNKYFTREGFKSGISFKDTLNGWATLGSDTGRPLNPGLYVTHDGGKSWMREAFPVPQNIDSIGTTPPVLFGNTGILPTYITQAGQQKLLLYVTHDRGETWNPTTPVNVDSRTVYVIDPMHIWATQTQTGQFYYTSDGGKTWQHSTNNPGQIQQLSFVDPTNGWAITQTSLLHMANGGSWNKINYSIQ